MKLFTQLLEMEKFTDAVVVMVLYRSRRLHAASTNYCDFRLLTHNPQLYNAILPAFFTESSSLASSIGIEKLQSTGIHVLRVLFAKFHQHRTAIMEEVVGGLLKLSNGKRLPRQYK
jgi:hypothetical protein